MNTLFISYASDDQAVALEVCAQLEAQGVRCWIAPRDVAPGAKWDEALLQAIDAAGAFLLLLSEASNESPFVQNEVNRAFGKKKPIFTFRIEDIPPSGSLEFYLARHHWTDGFPPPLEPKVAQLAVAVSGLLGVSDLSGTTGTAVATGAAAAPPRAKKRAGAAPAWRRTALIGALCALAGGLTASGAWYAARPAPPSVTRLAIAPIGAETPSIDGNERDLAITADGRRIVYVGNRGSTLFARALDVLTPTPLATGAPRGPFVSPDGQWVGFVDGGTQLKRVAITGGSAVQIASLDATARGATWLPDDTIVFATAIPTSGLQRVPASGGTAIVLTRPDTAHGEVDHLWPEALPGGRAVVYTITTAGGPDAGQIAVLDLATGTSKTVLRGGSQARYVPTGHLVYAAGGALRAVAFDLSRLEARENPVVVLPRLVVGNFGSADAVVSAHGTLAYLDAFGASLTVRSLVWVDRDGREEPLGAPARAYTYARISPDGERLVLSTIDEEGDLWMWDLARRTLTRLTFGPQLDTYPVWSLEGRRIYFSSEWDGARNLYVQAADGTGSPERLTESPNQQNVTAVSPDGKRLIFHQTTPATNSDILQLALDGTHEVTPLVQTSFIERNGRVSPDGKWLAYEANDSGRQEIYVRPYPDVNSGKWQVSAAGGTRPVWSHDGGELFYLVSSATGVSLMRVGVQRGSGWSATTPVTLFEGPYFVPAGSTGVTYDVSSDGRHFLIGKQESASDAPPQIVVVQHWFEELKKLVPVN
ncbi:MAG: hypothetical protein A3H29_12820 [Acidobacteria bacterium RIFCSPLOWO2_02_FULL_67_21]|nr:MAG: hypothetical protein A3H29_12820 [Acidobacteria bacterium RIFCSPLOWO2_02_FULL_67_21]